MPRSRNGVLAVESPAAPARMTATFRSSPAAYRRDTRSGDRALRLIPGRPAVEWGHAGAGPVICRAEASTSTDGRQPMVNQQRLNAVEYEIDLIDQEIVELFAAGYMVEVDRRLDDRRAQQTLRDRLRRGDVPNG